MTDTYDRREDLLPLVDTIDATDELVVIDRNGPADGRKVRIRAGNLSGGGGAALPDFATAEASTGRKWIDGKTIYQKVVDIGALLNNAEKSVPHGIAGLGTVVALTGTVKNAGGVQLILPFVSISSPFCIALYNDAANILIATGNDRTAYSGYAMIQYTKNV